MFLTINGDVQITNKFIKSITYELNTGKREPAIIITDPPFKLTRLSTVSYWVTMNILFQPWTKAAPLIMDHELRCSIGGKVDIIDLKNQMVSWEDETNEAEMSTMR